MRMLLKNKQDIFYSNLDGEESVFDEYGNETGEKTIKYTTPQMLSINVSAARGSLDLEQFGINADYSKTMVTEDLDCPIVEGSILWVGITPDELEHNYVVTSVAKSLNQITYAIKEVSKS